jgi:hypothetical protein
MTGPIRTTLNKIIIQKAPKKFTLTKISDYSFLFSTTTRAKES